MCLIDVQYSNTSWDTDLSRDTALANTQFWNRSKNFQDRMTFCFQRYVFPGICIYVRPSKSSFLLHKKILHCIVTRYTISRYNVICLATWHCPMRHYCTYIMYIINFPIYHVSYFIIKPRSYYVLYRVYIFSIRWFHKLYT